MRKGKREGRKKGRREGKGGRSGGEENPLTLLWHFLNNQLIQASFRMESQMINTTQFHLFILQVYNQLARCQKQNS